MNKLEEIYSQFKKDEATEKPKVEFRNTLGKKAKAAKDGVK